MAERGQKTRLELGGVSAEISLIKTSEPPPREARYDVRRGDEPSPSQKARDHEAEVGHDTPDGDVEAMVDASALDHDDPFAGTSPIDPPEPRPEAVQASPRHDDLAGAAEPEPEEPVHHGLWLGEGPDEHWVDLTEQLEAIDKATIIKGMSIVATIPSASVPRERVRDSHWVAATGGAEASEFLTYIWHALGDQGRVAVVRWTKKKNQSLGVLAARRVGRRRALLLLELEWSSQMRAPSERVLSSIEADISASGRESAESLIKSLADSPDALNDLRDERTAKRAELLESARNGTLDDFEVPDEPGVIEDGDNIAAKLSAAASR